MLLTSIVIMDIPSTPMIDANTVPGMHCSMEAAVGFKVVCVVICAVC